MSEDGALDLEIEDEETEVKENNQQESVWKKKIKSELSEADGESKDEKEEWLKGVEDKLDDPKEDHRIMSRALENPMRRKIMKFIGLRGGETVKEIKENFDLNESEAKMHLDFLEQAVIIEETNGDSPAYKLTPRGKNYLENVEEVL